MPIFIRVLLILAYICYVHPHDELHIANNFPNPNNQLFISAGIIFAITYFVISIGY